MNNKLQLYGRITDNGKPAIQGIERFNELFKSYPGKRFIMEISVLEPDNIFHHVWYIIKMIVPAFIEGNLQQGIIITPEEALDEIIDICPIFYKTKNLKHKVFNWKQYQPECDMSAYELEVAIEWFHLYCLENFNIIINYKSIKNEKSEKE